VIRRLAQRQRRSGRWRRADRGVRCAVLPPRLARRLVRRSRLGRRSGCAGHAYRRLRPHPIAKLDGQVQAPATVQIDTLDGDVDTAVASPVKRVRASAGLHAGRTPPVERLPVTVDVPPGGMVRLNLDMGHIVSGGAPSPSPTGRCTGSMVSTIATVSAVIVTWSRR
jgi:hypothetical protein